MTVPYERTNAVVSTHSFLLSLCDATQTPRVPKSVRQQAAHLLRHYPSKFQMDVIADREDNVPEAIKIKIFGRGFN